MKTRKNKPEGISNEKIIGSDPWEALVSAAKSRVPERPEHGRTFHEIQASLGFGRDKARAELNRMIAAGTVERVDGVITHNGQLKATQFYVPVKRDVCSARSGILRQASVAQ